MTPTKIKKIEKKFPPALEILIPEPEISQRYVSRMIEEVRDLDALAHAHKEQMNVLISGPTGPGKTMCAMAYCSVNKFPFVSVPCDGAIEPGALFGRPSVDVRTGGLRWIWGPVSLAVMHGGMLYFDEINAMPGRISTAVHGLLDGRRILTLIDHPFTHIDPTTGEYLVIKDETTVSNMSDYIPVDGPAYLKANPDLFVVGTYNPGYHDMRPLNQALENRFALRLEFGYDEDVEKELIKSKALRDLAKAIRTADEDIQTPVSTNMLMEFERLANADIVASGEEVPMFKFALYVFLNHFPIEDRQAISIKIKTMHDKLMSDFGLVADA